MSSEKEKKVNRSRAYYPLVGSIGLLIILLMITWTNLRGIAAFLIVPQIPINADIAVVLSGGSIPRVLAARDLYKNGSVKKILLIPEPSGTSSADKELHKLGISRMKANEITQRILEASQVPPSDVLTLPHSINGTINEAKAVDEFLEDFPKIKQVAIVTTKLNSQRQCYIFRQVLADTEILCHASPYDNLNIDNWWTHPRQALGIFIEYLKLISNFLTLLVK